MLTQRRSGRRGVLTPAWFCGIPAGWVRCTSSTDFHSLWLNLNTHGAPRGSQTCCDTLHTPKQGGFFGFFSPGRQRAGLRRRGPQLPPQPWERGGPRQPPAVVQHHTGAIQPRGVGGWQERRQVGAQPRHPGEGLRATGGSCGQDRGFMWHRPRLFRNAPSPAQGKKLKGPRDKSRTGKRVTWPAAGQWEAIPSSAMRKPIPNPPMLPGDLLHASPNFGQEQGKSSGGFLLPRLPAAGKETAAPKGHGFSKIRSWQQLGVPHPVRLARHGRALRRGRLSLLPGSEFKRYWDSDNPSDAREAGKKKNTLVAANAAKGRLGRAAVGAVRGTDAFPQQNQPLFPLQSLL